MIYESLLLRLLPLYCHHPLRVIYGARRCFETFYGMGIHSHPP